MERLILDTGILIAAVRGQVDMAVFDNAHDVALASIVVGEYLAGTLLDDDPGRAAAQRAFLDEVLQLLPLCDYDSGVGEHHAALLAHVRQSGDKRGAHDLIIAATARATGRTILTTDARARFAELPGVTARVIPTGR